MASDGLWDILTLSKAVKIARPKNTEQVKMRGLTFPPDALCLPAAVYIS